MIKGGQKTAFYVFIMKYFLKSKSVFLFKVKKNPKNVNNS